MTDKTNIGGMNLSDIEDSDTRVGDVDASVTAQGHIAGRDVIIYNYHYAAQAQVSPPAPTETDADEPLPDNPYRGLFAFRPEHADLFFGREKFTAQLVAAVESRRLVTVLGASGSGKSSVVFAGLVPELVNRPGEPWRFTTFRPGDDPFQNLAAAMVPLYETSLDKTDQMVATRKLSAALQSGDLPLADVLASIRETHSDHRLLLIADQFEELYTLCRDADIRHAFLDLLLDIFHPQQPKIQNLKSKIAFTLRADFLGQASLYRPFADALQGTTELLGPMTDAELRDAIEQPAALQGVTFEEGLVETLLADVGHEEGSLPLLEFALSELWQHQRQRTLTHSAYVEIGKVEGALSRHADRAYHSLLPAEQQQARRIFVQLVNPGRGAEDTRRLATRNELGQNWALVAKLASERLVVTGSAGDNEGEESEERQDTVEVVHEALIRNWGQLREWMAQDREFLTWLHGLRTDLNRWQAGDGSLLQDTALNVAEEWLAKRPDDLNPAEREYIEAGVARREALEAEKEAQRQALLDAERKQREEAEARQQEQAQAAADLRKRAMWLAVAGGAAVVLAVVAGWFGWQSNKNAVEAENQAASAVAAQKTAETARIEAENERNNAATAEAQAVAAAESLAEQNEKAQAELNFYQTTNPAERLTELHNLFSRPDRDSQARARHLFFSLPEIDQLALLRVTDQPEALAAVDRELLPNFGDVNGIYYTSEKYLIPLLENVEEPDLQATLEGWLAAREAAGNKDYDAALAQYTALLETNGQNPALYLERARMNAKLGQPAAALADLATVMELAQAPKYAGSGVLRIGPEFVTTGQMRKAVARLIFVNDNLMTEYEANDAGYKNLPAVKRPEVTPDDHEVPMVRIPAGKFKMGSNDGSPDEQPVHEVYLDAYYIDQYEVTNARYAEFLNEQGNREEGGVTWYNPERGAIEQQEDVWRTPANFDKHPVTGVSWYGAGAYCAWRGGQLPTEAQWEKAARGTDERTYPWGEGIAPHLARYSGSEESGTVGVGHYPEGVSPYGVYDMAGNVWEWVADAYDSVYYAKSPAKNPTGPEDEQNISSKVLRGGSWFDLDIFARASDRSSGYLPVNQVDFNGFRCVAAAPG